MKKILITGSNGLLGRKLVELYREKENKEVWATSRGERRHPEYTNVHYRELDICNEADVEKLLLEIRPDTVINTAAMTNVDACETDQKGCDQLNIDAVRYLAENCNKIGAHLIHLSTDFIFDGKNGPYAEEDKAEPLSHYGWSKLEGEGLVKKLCKKWTILRTILVYGVVSDMSRSNIVLWAKGALEGGKPIQVVDDQYRMPTLAEDLAMGCFLAEDKEAEGIFHISGDDFMNVYELVQRVAAFWKLDTKQVSRANSSSFTQPAKRPLVTGFKLDKAKKILGYKPHSFEEGLAIVAAQLKEAGKN